MFADLGGGDGGGGRNQDIAKFPKLTCSFGPVNTAEFLGLQVINGGNQAAGFEQGTDFGAEIIAAGEVGLDDAGCFGGQDDMADGDDIAEPAEFELDDGSAPFVKCPQGGFDHGADFRVDAFEEELFTEADAKAFEFGLIRDGDLWQGIFAGVSIARVRTRDGVENGGAIAAGLSKRPHVIEAEAERKGTVAADGAVSGFDAGGATVTGGDANAAPGIGTHGGKDHACTDRGAGSAAGTAGDAGGIPGVANGTVMGVVGGNAKGELVHAKFAGEDGTGGFEFFDYGGVIRRDEAAEDFAPGGGEGALGVIEILDGDGDTLQGSAINGPGKIGVGLFCGGDGGVCGESEKGVELGLQLFGELEALLGELKAGNFFGAQRRRGFKERH